MQEFRCKGCHRLLARYHDCKGLEVKCPRCGLLNQLVNTPSLESFKLIRDKRNLLDSFPLCGGKGM